MQGGKRSRKKLTMMLGFGNEGLVAGGTISWNDGMMFAQLEAGSQAHMHTKRIAALHSLCLA